MPEATSDDVWWWVAGGVGAALAGSAAIVWSSTRHGPPKEHSLTPAGEGPEPVHPGEPLLPPAGTKAKSYPGTRGKSVPSSTWRNMHSQPGLGIVVRNPNRAWGTPDMIDTITRAAAKYRQFGAPFELEDTSVRVADISKKGGGPLSPHVSHQKGRDVDITIAGATSKLPTVALPILLRAFLEDPNTQVIFLDWGRQGDTWHAIDLEPELDPTGLVKSELQYPLGRHSGRTRVRHWPGHAGHIHVRTRV